MKVREIGSRKAIGPVLEEAVLRNYIKLLDSVVDDLVNPVYHITGERNKKADAHLEGLIRESMANKRRKR